MAGISGLRAVLLGMLVLLASAGVYLLLFRGGSGTGAPAAGLEPLVFPEEIVPTAVIAPALTHDASELRRIAAEHSRLLTSLPPTPTPTLPPEALREEGVAASGLNLDGSPLPAPELAAWFDPSVGLDFYREEGGDWTLREVRASHPYRELFYYDSYPEEVGNFADESIYPALARRLAAEAVEVLPSLGAVSDVMVSAFSQRLGWSIRDESGPVINVWTTFTVYDRNVASRYAVGGVMLLETRVWGGGDGEEPLEFLAPGGFAGPVVVQRTATEVSRQ